MGVTPGETTGVDGWVAPPAGVSPGSCWVLQRRHASGRGAERGLMQWRLCHWWARQLAGLGPKHVQGVGRAAPAPALTGRRKRELKLFSPPSDNVAADIKN